MMKKFILLAGFVGAACAGAMNSAVEPRNANNLYEAVQSVNPQLVERIQNRSGQSFIPLNDARSLLSAISGIAGSDDSHRWALDLFAEYVNNINRRNIGSFTKLWGEIVEQASQQIAEDIAAADTNLGVRIEEEEEEPEHSADAEAASGTALDDHDGRRDSASVSAGHEEEERTELPDSEGTNEDNVSVSAGHEEEDHAELSDSGVNEENASLDV